MLYVQLYVWRENDQVMRRCRWVIPRTSLRIDHFDLSADFLAVISTDGQAFTGIIPITDCTHSSSQESPRTGDYDYVVTSITLALLNLLLNQCSNSLAIDRLEDIH